jgi:hypothetical protein
MALQEAVNLYRQEVDKVKFFCNSVAFLYVYVLLLIIFGSDYQVVLLWATVNRMAAFDSPQPW